MSSVAKPDPVSSARTIANALDFTDTIAFSDNPHPLADVFMLYKNISSGPTESVFAAFEFVFEWCVQEFNTSVLNGTAFTTRQGSTSNFTGRGSFLTEPTFNTTSMFSDSTTNYNVANDTHFILSNYLRKTLIGTVYQEASGFYKSSDAAEAFFQRFNPHPRMEDVAVEARDEAGLAQVLQNMATSMTNM
jgi:hypothetical protein